MLQVTANAERQIVQRIVARSPHWRQGCRRCKWCRLRSHTPTGLVEATIVGPAGPTTAAGVRSPRLARQAPAARRGSLRSTPRRARGHPAPGSWRTPVSAITQKHFPLVHGFLGISGLTQPFPWVRAFRDPSFRAVGGPPRPLPGRAVGLCALGLRRVPIGHWAQLFLSRALGLAPALLHGAPG